MANIENVRDRRDDEVRDCVFKSWHGSYWLRCNETNIEVGFVSTTRTAATDDSIWRRHSEYGCGEAL